MRRSARAPHWQSQKLGLLFPLCGRTPAFCSTEVSFVLLKTTVTAVGNSLPSRYPWEPQYFYFLSVCCFSLSPSELEGRSAPEVIWRTLEINALESEIGLSLLSESAFNKFTQHMIIDQYDTLYTCLQRNWRDRDEELATKMTRVEVSVCKVGHLGKSIVHT